METMDFIATQAVGKWTVVYGNRVGEQEYLHYTRRIDALQSARRIVRAGSPSAIVMEPDGNLINRWGGQNVMRLV